MEFPQDETGFILSEMHEAGIDLTKEHTIDFYLLFEKEAHARSMEQALKADDASAKVSVQEDPEVKNVWELVIKVDMVPTHEALLEKETFLESYADKHNGYGDGWGIAE